MIYEVMAGKPYRSKNSGTLFRVCLLARHGQDCSERQVVYSNEEPTTDYPVGELWVVSESIFIKTMEEVQ